ncbi:MAG: helix-turn-helix transcriptional regulator [Pseudorhodobacter sp.]
MSESSDIKTIYLTVEQVAKRFGCSTDSIWRWKRSGRFPAAVRVGPGCTRWRLSDIEEYESRLEACFAFDAGLLLDSEDEGDEDR